MDFRPANRGPALRIRELVRLNPDHPGFHDPTYRERRNVIAGIALDYRTGDPVPRAHYTDEEHGVWRQICQLLEPLHQRFVCRPLVDQTAAFPLDLVDVPQLVDLNCRLSAATGFRMEPVGGLVAARSFLEALGRGVFLSTQYIRHHSRPLYTPEPDIVHELIGHAATLAHPRIAAVSRAFGRAVELADDEQAERIERVYWYTLEFGLVEEKGQARAFGAGLLSSAGELAQINEGPALLEWDLDAIAETPYDPTRMQPHLFVAPSFDRMLDDLEAWLLTEQWMGRGLGVVKTA